MRLSNNQKSFLALLRRSPDDTGYGWRTVSTELKKLAGECVAERPELYETDCNDVLRVRLSLRGLILADYL